MIQIPYTLAQIRNATKAQIITAISDKLQTMTKRQIIVWLMENVDRVSNRSETRRQDGQFDTITETETDVETGQVVLTKTTTFTYYNTGEVHAIEVNEDGATSIILHFTDGRQPRIATMMDKILIALGLL